MPTYSILDQTLDAAAALERATDKLLAPYDLTTGRYRLLRALRRAELSGGAFSVGHLAALLMTESHTVSGMLSRMTDAGLVARIPGADRRSVIVELTDFGRAREKEASSAYENVAAALDMAGDLPIDPPYGAVVAKALFLGENVAPLPEGKRAQAFRLAGWAE